MSAICFETTLLLSPDNPLPVSAVWDISAGELTVVFDSPVLINGASAVGWAAIRNNFQMVGDTQVQVDPVTVRLDFNLLFPQVAPDSYSLQVPPGTLTDAGSNPIQSIFAGVYTTVP